MRIKATDGSGEFDVFVVAPTHKPGGAVVLIQEIFGVNDALREQAQWVADLGFFAVCPDLFWRIEPDMQLTDKTDAEWQRAFALMKAFDQNKGIDDLKVTLAAARALPGTNGRAGTMGFCLGGRLAFRMAMESDADLNISYYGVALDGLIDGLGRVTSPLICHVADRDQYFSAEGRAKLDQAALGRDKVTIHHYNADHAFARPYGVHWQALAATIANGRSAEALAKYL